jgi:hypothetical protein
MGVSVPRFDSAEALKLLPPVPTYKKILYRLVGAVVILAAIAFPAVSSVAQEEENVPLITPRQTNTGNKKDQGPRALGLLQLTSSGKATLVPIAIRINGRFYDAAAYKATPIPMALEPGTVYEGMRTGTSAGLFTTNGALHSQDPSNPIPWIGTGMWLPAGTEAPKTGMKAEAVPIGIETTDEPPRLTKSTAAKNPPAEAPASPSGPSSSVPQNTPSTSPGSKPSGSNPSDKTQSSQAPTTSSSATAKPADQANQSPKDQTAKPEEDANRPRLRRGKPTEPLPSDENVPGYSKPQASGSATAAKGDRQAPAKTAAVPNPPADLVPAISDAGGPDPRSYAFVWNQGEEGERRKQMVALAREQLRTYLDTQAKATIATTPGEKPATQRKPSSKASEPVLENVQLRTFDLWGNNQPVLVLSAEARLPQAAAKGNPAPAAPAEYTLTLAARTDIYDKLHKLYFSVTDKYHLDVTPRLELIDAVDADGDGRGELLFRETTDAGSGYVIYRATADTLWKMFDSLSPQ